MLFIVFKISVTLVYVVGVVTLIREMWASSRNAWGENQSIPLLIASTVTYVVAIRKTYQLVQMCSG